MTYEEALRWTDDSLSQGKVLPEQESYAYMGVVKIALEKQIPKQPKKYIAFDGIKRNGCPTCDHNEILYGGQRYCSVCGQKIDWNADEET